MFVFYELKTIDTLFSRPQPLCLNNWADNVYSERVSHGLFLDPCQCLTELSLFT